MKKSLLTLLFLVSTHLIFTQVLTRSKTSSLIFKGPEKSLPELHLNLQFRPKSENSLYDPQVNLLPTLSDPLQKKASQLFHSPLVRNSILIPNYSLNNLPTSLNQPKNMFSNRRLKYSSLWAFTSLNYLYADLVGLMDVNLLSQYLTGSVNGIDITPGFLTGAAAFMQIPLANVFLPQVIKNDKTLRWIQIVSGTVMTLAQTATLFVGDRPAPYYMLFSAIEIGATAYITIDAIKWKPFGKK